MKVAAIKPALHTIHRPHPAKSNRYYTSFLLLFLCQFLLSFELTAQIQNPGFYDTLAGQVRLDSSVKVYISSIQVTGNKRTKKYIIQREMRLKTGDSILASELYDRLLKSRELVYNTALFTAVSIEPVFASAKEINLVVTVSEKWYIYPTPQFQLIDRNFNEWINTYHADLERVSYGVKFAHYNLTGRRDQLRVYLLNGYSRNISFTYNAPYSNRALTEGFSVSAGLTQNREVIYNTSKTNKPLRYTNAGFARSNFSIAGSYSMRKGFYLKRTLNVALLYFGVDDSITSKYNPSYFNTTRNRVILPEITYVYQYINTNNIKYPLKGKIYSFAFTKRGTGLRGGMNLLSADFKYNRYFTHRNEWYSTLHAHTKIKAPGHLAFMNQRALGYQDYFLRGLENYVIDGIHSFVAGYTLRKKILSFNIVVPFKNKLVSSIPFAIYAKTYADAGYSFSKQINDTRLGNRLLRTGGFGIDILSLYDTNVQLEYSFNQLGEKGLFLHAKSGF